MLKHAYRVTPSLLRPPMRTTNQGLTTLGVAVRAVRLEGAMSDPFANHEGVVHSSEAGHQPAGIGEHHLSTTPLGDRHLHAPKVQKPRLHP